VRSINPNKPLISIVLGAVCISFAPILVKAIGFGSVGVAEIGPTGIGMYRCLIGAGLLFLAAARRGDQVVLPRKILGMLALAGFIFFLDLFVWHRSILLAGAGIATILGNTQVFATAILSFMLLGEKLSGKFMMAAVSAMGGVVLLVGIGSGVSFSDDYLAGIIYGLLTGIAYASFILVVRRVGTMAGNGTNLVRIAWISLFTALFLGAAALVEGDAAPPAGIKTWVLLFLLGLIAQSAGWVMIARSLPKVPGAIGGLVLLLQPVLATVWGVALFGESLTWVQTVGAGVTLLAIYIGSTQRAEKKLPENS